MTSLMTNLGAPAQGPDLTRFDAAYLAWNSVGSYERYDDAQTAVDRLADAGFPVAKLDIIGSDVRLVERVTGRLTKGGAALAGARGGVWMGAFLGLFVGLFSAGGWLAALLTGMVIGAAWGAFFGWLGHAGTRGRREFASTRQLVAAHYDIIARDGTAEQARQLLFTNPEAPAAAPPWTER
jgi:hypothetical protein